MKSAVHFVRFSGASDQRFQNAVRVFGQPDFMHRSYDARAVVEVVKGDTVVFAAGDQHQPVCRYTYDDSSFQ